MNQTKIYQLEKSLWTDADFEVMGWHDNPIHAISFDDDSKMSFDIDYIFEWVLRKNKRYYDFWIAPCTLVFEHVYSIALKSDFLPLEIMDISKTIPEPSDNPVAAQSDVVYDWIIETTTGEILFKSTGFKQYVRQIPILINTQGIERNARGGISFSLDNITI